MASINALEWLAGNKHRNYPLAESSAGRSPIPTSFIVDIDIFVPSLPDSDGTDRFFIKSITATRAEAVIEIGYNSEQYGELVCARSTPINTVIDDSATLTEKTINLISVDSGALASRLAGIEGKIVIGTCRDIVNIGYASYSADETPIIGLRVHEFPVGVAGIATKLMQYGGGSAANSTMVSTDVILREGDGISLDVHREYDDTLGKEVDVIVVSRSEDYNVDVGLNEDIESVEDAVTAIINQIGNPIRSINGIAPDAQGNFSILGSECITVEGAGNRLELKNPCSTPCCALDNDDLDKVNNALQMLEDAIERLSTYYQELSDNVNTVQSRLATTIASGGRSQ